MAEFSEDEHGTVKHELKESKWLAQWRETWRFATAILINVAGLQLGPQPLGAGRRTVQGGVLCVCLDSGCLYHREITVTPNTGFYTYQK